MQDEVPFEPTLEVVPIIGGPRLRDELEDVSIRPGPICPERVWNIRDLTCALPYDRRGGGSARMGGDVGYGLSLWLMPHRGAVHMSGMYGNYVIIDPATALVVAVVQHGRPDRRPYASDYLDVVRAALRDGGSESNSVTESEDEPAEGLACALGPAARSAARNKRV